MRVLSGRRKPGVLAGAAIAIALHLACAFPPSLLAQDSAAVAAPDTRLRARAPDDTVSRPPISPLGGLWRSFLVPGWGQAKLDRKTTGAIFVAWEGVTLAMTLKTQHELEYLRRTGSGRVSAKKQQREDWLILLAFNHLFAGLEAFVSAHLWDFPGDLKFRATSDQFGAQLQIPLPHR